MSATAPTSRPSARERTARRAVAACLAAVAGLVVSDALLFRTPLYTRILNPDSAAGTFELVLARERHAQAANGDNLIITFGNSRFAYAPRLANELTGKTGYVFRNGGIAGSDARVWYYMLRDLDPLARRYRAVVVGVADYEDVDDWAVPVGDPGALHYVIEHLRWSDVLDFAHSTGSRQLAWEALRGGILKGMVLQADIRDFLSHPARRLAYASMARRGFDGWTYGYVESEKTMAGLRIDWPTGNVAFPPGVDQEQKDTVLEGIHPILADAVKVAAFRRQWLGRIVERYRNSRTRVIFVRLPRGPIPRPEIPVPKTSSVIRELASQANVHLVPEHAFDSLERPELFKDGLHLNRAGVARFSSMLAEEIGRMLAHERR